MSRSIIFLVKLFLGNFYRHWAIFIDIWRFFSGHTGGGGGGSSNKKVMGIDLKDRFRTFYLLYIVMTDSKQK